MAQQVLPHNGDEELNRILSRDSYHLHSFADLWSLKRYGETKVIARSEGVHVCDASGNRFLDGIGGPRSGGQL